MRVQEIVKESFWVTDALRSAAGRITGLETTTPTRREDQRLRRNRILIIIAARPSMGKTSFAMNIAENVAIEDQKTSQSFPWKCRRKPCCNECCVRGASGRSQIPHRIPLQDDMRKIVASAGDLTQAPIFIDDTPGITVSEMRAKSRRLLQSHGSLDLIWWIIFSSCPEAAAYENRTRKSPQFLAD